MIKKFKKGFLSKKGPVIQLKSNMPFSFTNFNSLGYPIILICILRKIHVDNIISWSLSIPAPGNMLRDF